MARRHDELTFLSVGDVLWSGPVEVVGLALHGSNTAMSEEDPYLLFMSPSSTLSTGILHYEETVIVTSDDVAMVGMDSDYWSESEKGHIISQSLHNRSQSAETVLKDLNKPAHLSWDWVTRNMYFSRARGTVQYEL